jgi:hypothetical protein
MCIYVIQAYIEFALLQLLLVLEHVVKPCSEVMSCLIIAEFSYILGVEQLVIIIWESRTACYVMVTSGSVKLQYTYITFYCSTANFQIFP